MEIDPIKYHGALYLLLQDLHDLKWMIQEESFSKITFATKIYQNFKLIFIKAVTLKSLILKQFFCSYRQAIASTANKTVSTVLLKINEVRRS